MFRYALTDKDKAYIKRLKRCWFMMSGDVTKTEAINLNNKNYKVDVTKSLLGNDTKNGVLQHYGFGSAGYKVVNTQSMIEQGIDFQPYLSVVTGDLVGRFDTTSVFSYDPSNLRPYSTTPIMRNIQDFI